MLLAKALLSETPGLALALPPVLGPLGAPQHQPPGPGRSSLGSLPVFPPYLNTGLSVLDPGKGLRARGLGTEAPASGSGSRSNLGPDSES